MERASEAPDGREDRRTSRRGFLEAAGLVGIGGLALSACGGGDDDTGTGTASASGTATAASGAAAGLLGEPKKVIWALAAIAPWNLQLDVGFTEATRTLGWEYQKVGVPIAQYSAESVVNVVSRAAAARPDVLVTPAWVPGLEKVVRKAQDDGILVMFNNANNLPELSNELGIAFIGADEYEGGKALAPVLFEAMRRAGKSDGVVLGGLPFPGNDNVEMRLEGARDGLMELNRLHGTNFEYERFIDGSARGNAPAQTAYRAKLRHLGDDGVAGILSISDVNGVIPALRSSGVEPGEVPIGTWDLLESTITGIEQGWVAGTVNAQPYQQGYMPVMLAWQEFERGQTPRDYDSGGAIVTQATIAATARAEAVIRDKAKEYDIKLS